MRRIGCAWGLCLAAAGCGGSGAMPDSAALADLAVVTDLAMAADFAGSDDAAAPDLAAPDLAVAPDFAIPNDLTPPPDLVPPPDLTPTCSDGVKNGGESDVDCGGGCGRCDPGKGCALPGDCGSGVCAQNLCQSPTCADGVKNGKESDVDCGGPDCPRCGSGRMCAGGGDCGTGVCTMGVCVDAACNDGILNGSETDLDCGGACARCGDGKKCKAPSDCASGVCAGGVCAAASCMDTVKNGAETDVDCGGGKCPKCAVGKICAQPADCATAFCGKGLCIAPACNDGVKNGDETDVDCGGSCTRCAAGKTCLKPIDCTSGVCGNGTCSVPNCVDGVKNGNETDVDCGGGCGGCATGKACGQSADCKAGVCDANACRPPKSCLELLQAQPGSQNGQYAIDPDGPGGSDAFAALCDLTTNGGGWTYLAQVANGDGRSWSEGTPTPNNWENSATFGNLDPAANADYKSAAYATVPGKAVMITYQNQFLLRSDDSCLASITLKQRFNMLGWDSSGSQDYSGFPSSAHPCVIAQVQAVVGEKALVNGQAPVRLFVKAGEADGAQDGNRDRDYFSTNVRFNVDYPRGLGAQNAGACNPPNCENDIGGYNPDGSGNDIAVPGSANDYYGLWIR